MRRRLLPDILLALRFGANLVAWETALDQTRPGER
jgi:hypothetical protein